MKCDVCNREFNNSEELMQHKEQMHPIDEGEMPDLAPKKRDMPDSEPAQTPEPMERGR